MPGRDFLTKIAVPSFLSISLLASAAGRASAWQLEHNVPSAVRLGIDQGAADSSDEMNVTVHLKMHDRAAFDAALEQLYNPASSKYHQWMTDAELQKYAPTAAEVAKVRSELEKHGLTVVSADPQGFSIRVHGTVSNVENAFQTHIHQFAMNDKAFRANVQDARLTGDAGNLVTSVSGLSSHAVQPLFKRANDPRTGQPYAPIALSVVNAKGGLGSIVENKCFTDPQTFTYTTPGSKLPVGVYFGNVYDDSTKICDFTPAELQRRYGLDAAHKAGFDGTGQTIALIEGYGYPTMLQDANTFNQLSGLPLFNSSNFEVIYPEGPPKSPVAGIIAGWNVEIALDIQWAHVVAPNAKIIVVAAAGQDIEDLEDALSYAITHKL
ncbi:MAG: hypothetical protein JO061_18700, partial [Acidobacteriaceae bacterium]|nr:hypothetical protein [Acidobacteriaceae bacterium]